MFIMFFFCYSNIIFFCFLIKRGTISNEFGNVSDDNVQNYDYDFVFDNNKGLDELEKDFVSFFENKMIN